MVMGYSLLRGKMKGWKKMKSNEFNRYMTAVVNGMMAIKNDMESESKKQIIQHARWVYRKCVKEMKDTRQNIKRWLGRKPCLFKHPFTGNVIEYDIGADFEALYYFLEWCRRLQRKGLTTTLSPMSHI